MSKTKLVFFDFDGVILDSANIKTEAFPMLFKDYPEHVSAITQYHIDNQGLSRYKKFEWIYKTLFKKELSKSQSHEWGQKFSDIVLNKVLNAKFIKGSEELLNVLQSKQIISVVASGTPYKELHKIVEERNLAHYFKEVWGSPKSKSDIITDVLYKYNLEPSEALFLGDASTDYDAALSCHVPFLAIYSKEMISFWESKNIETIDNLNEIIKQYFNEV